MIFNFLKRSKTSKEMIPATKEQYINWLVGFLEKGGKITHNYDYPFSKWETRFFITNGSLSLPPLTGSNSINLIVREEDEVEIIKGSSHNNIFYMKDYAKLGIVPSFSDLIVEVYEDFLERKGLGFQEVIRSKIVEFLPELKNDEITLRLLKNSLISDHNFNRYLSYLNLMCESMLEISMFRYKTEKPYTNEIEDSLILEMNRSDVNYIILEHFKKILISQRKMIPATKEQYINWLVGFLEKGGKITHNYDYPFSKWETRFFITNGSLSLPPLTGSNSINLIVREEDEVEIIKGSSHNNIFYMKDYAKLGIVPSFSDLIVEVYEDFLERKGLGFQEVIRSKIVEFLPELKNDEITLRLLKNSLISDHNFNRYLSYLNLMCESMLEISMFRYKTEKPYTNEIEDSLILEMNRSDVNYIILEHFKKILISQRKMIPATKEQYINWLVGFLEKGGKITHNYDYPFSKWETRFFITNGSLSLPPLTGSNSINLIVREEDEVEIIKGSSHNNIFYMKDYAKLGHVPCFSDINL